MAFPESIPVTVETDVATSCSMQCDPNSAGQHLVEDTLTAFENRDVTVLEVKARFSCDGLVNCALGRVCGMRGDISLNTESEPITVTASYSGDPSAIDPNDDPSNPLQTS